MTTFDKREDAYEARFAHEEELRFKALAHRNRLLGLWAASLLGKSGEAAESYAASLVTGFLAADDEPLFAKLRGDFDAAGVAESSQHLREKMGELLSQATAELKPGA